MRKLILNLIPALRAISAHKLQSAFSGIGIVFGIAFLINFFAVQKGYKDYLEQQQSVSGTNNILITPVIPAPDFVETLHATSLLSNGLNMDDAKSIHKLFPDVASICSNLSYEANVNYELIHKQVKISGVCEDYFKIFSNRIYEGRAFMPIHFQFSKPVCIISSDLKKNLFANKNPLGEWIRCNDLYLKVIGVIQVKNDIIIPEELRVLGNNNVVYTPMPTIMTHSGWRAAGPAPSGFVTPNSDNPNRLEKIIIHFNDIQKTDRAAEIINKMLLRRHNNVRDFKIIIPEHILKKETIKSRIAMFTILMFSMICLFIGGINITNYMYASLYERSDSLAQLMSKGASRFTVYFQFLSQGAIVSFAGGLIGIIVGIIFSKLFFNATKITTIVPFSSIIISFIISICVGIFFSYFPLRKLMNNK